MGLFGKSTSKQTAKVKSLVKLVAARLAVVRRPRLGRRNIARSDVGQLLSIGHSDRALLRAKQVIEENNMLDALDIIELYCKVLIEQAAQLDNPKECSEEIKEAAAGLMFASARCGDLPELLDARAILADKFGRDFARGAKEGDHGVVDPTLVRKLSGERPSLEQKRRLAKEIAAENDILLEFPPETPVESHQAVRTTSRINSSQRERGEQTQNAPAREFVRESSVRTNRYEEQGRQNSVDGKVKVNPSLAQLSAEDRVLRESKKYVDARMAAEAAFASASFAAMAARAAVELSRSESQGKGPRGGGYDKAAPVQATAAAERGTAPASRRPQKSPSPSASPSWSDRSTTTSVGSDASHKGKEIIFDQSDEDEVAEAVVWPPPQQQRPPSYRRTASTVGTGVRPWHGDARARVSQDGAPANNQQQHRRHATEFAGGNERAQYVASPYRRNPTANAGRNSDADREGGAYESSAYVHQPYSRIVSALEHSSNEHIARHEEVRRIGTDARVLQERVYGAAPGQRHSPMNPEMRAASVRTRR